MKKIVVSCVVCWFVPALLAAQGLEPVPADQAAAFGAKLAELAGQLDKPQVAVAADASQANGVHLPEELGILVVPQKDLQEGDEAAARCKTERGAPLGFLFAYRVVPVIDGERIGVSRLRTLQVTDRQGQERTVSVLLLAVRQLAEDDYRLYGYGAGDQPLIDAKFAKGTGSGAGPVTVEVKDTDEQTRQGTIVVTVFGKYQASFRAAATDG